MKKFFKHGIAKLLVLLAAASIILGVTATVSATGDVCPGTGGNHTLLRMDYKKPLFTEAGWEAYEYCTQEDCGYTTFKAIPPLGEPEIDDYGAFIQNLTILEAFANQYAMENPGNDPLELVIKYIRTGVDRYNSGSWGIMAGYENKDFADYIRRTENAINYETENVDEYVKVTALKNINNFYLPNGDWVDIGHMFGTMDISYTNKNSIDHADVGGWAGDLVDLITSADADGDAVSGTIEEMVAILEESYFLHNPQENDVFSATDFKGDLDAYYIFNTVLGREYSVDEETGLGTLSQVVMEYFTEDLSQEDRAEYFLKNRLGNVGTREQVRRAVYNAYTGNKTVTTLEATREFITSSDNITQLRKASCYVFADYICRLAGDYVEIESNPYFTDFNVEASSLAPGVVHETHYATTADGKQIVYYTATADLSNENVTVYANYNESDPSLGWKMSRVLDQANAAQARYGDPESEHYIENYQVVASINADGFDMKTGKPGGLLVMNGTEWSAINSSGFFGITKEGKAVIGTTAEYNETYKGQLRDGVGAFGVTLVKDGKIAVAHSDDYTADRASRTSVGITRTGKVVFMVLDGRQEPRSCGGSMQEIAQIMLEAGCYQAVNLDGGGSTTFVSKPEGEEELKVTSSPSDGYARSVSTSLLMVSTAPSSTKFDHARLDTDYAYATIGTPIQITPIGLSATGNVVDLPESYEWRVATNSSYATVSEDGVFVGTSNRTFEIELVSDGEVIGSKTLEVVEPNNVYFKRKTLDAVYGSVIDIPVAAVYNGNAVAVSEGDIILTVQPASAGTFDGYKLNVAESATVKSATVIATLKNDESITSSMSINLYKQGENTFDFDKATGGGREFAWDRQVSNSTVDGSVYVAIDSEKDMVTSYVFAIDMKEIPIPAQLEDLTYMLPGADAVDASAWNFLLQLAERVSVLTEVKPVLEFDDRFDVDYSGLEVINEYFYLDKAELDEENNKLTLTLKWHDQTASIPAETANPLCMLKGIKLTPKAGVFEEVEKINALHMGEIEYTIYLRANALYTFSVKPENQEIYGLLPFENTFTNPSGEEQYERGGYFHDVYTTFEDRYTLSHVEKSGWVNEDGGFAYYIDGEKITGVQLVDGYYYNFGENGINIGQTKYTGLFEKDGTTYYALNGELIKSKWQVVGDAMYHCHDDGVACATTINDPITCIRGGVIVYTCGTCKTVNRSGFIFPEGHDWDENYVCRICGTVGKNIADATIWFGSVENPRQSTSTPKYEQTSAGIRPSTYITFDGVTALTKSNDNNLNSDNTIKDVYQTWTNDRGIGKAYTSFTGRGNYYGEGQLMHIIIPASVTGFTATAGVDSVTLTWNKAQGAGYYRVYKGANGGDWKVTKVTGTSCVMTGLEPGTEYTFSIATSAVSTDGEEKVYNGSKWANVTVTTKNACTTHTWDAGVVSKAATCTAAGEKTYTCTVCYTTKTETVAATGHNISQVAKVDATCTAAGNIEYYHCSNCNKNYTTAAGTTQVTDVVVPALGHDYVGVVTIEPTYTTEGEKTYTCTVCGDSYTETLAVLGHTHSWGNETITKAATCTDDGEKKYTCSLCGEQKTEVIAAMGHYVESFVAEIPATCTAEGTKAHYICSECDVKFKDAAGTEELTDFAIPALGHSISLVAKVDATCSEAGSIEHYACTACGKTFEDEAGTKEITDITIPATGEHAWNSGVVTKEPTEATTGVKTYTCTVCGAQKTEKIPALGHTHDYVGVITKAATCNEEGVKTYTCDCGDSYTEAIPTVEHFVENYVPGKAATCTASGTKAHFVCSDCGAKCTDSTGTEEIEDIVIPALGHSYDAGVVTVAPTHTAEGVKTYTCTACDDSYTEAIAKTTDHEYVGKVTKPATHTEEGVKTYTCGCGESYTETIAKLAAHEWGEGVVTVEPTYTTEGVKTYTCTCGEKKTEVLPVIGHTHSWDEGVVTKAATCLDDGEKTFTCTVCGGTKTEAIEATGHTYGEWVADGDNHKKTCICGDVVTEAHAWDAGVVTIEPTYTEEGLKTYTCTACGEQKTEVLAVLGHTHSWDAGVVTKSATCGEDGVLTYTCTVCYEQKTEAIPAMGHLVERYVPEVSATCTNDGTKAHFVCSDCGAKFKDAAGAEELTDVVIPALGHSYDAGVVTKAPTHTTEGVKTYTCGCGESYTETIDKVAGHEYVETVKPATCTADGVKTYACSCGDSYTVVIPATGHSYDDGVVTKAPTHTEEGVKTYTCTSCGDSYTETIDTVDGHEYTETVKPATCTADGVRTYTCECGDSYTETIPATGHSYDDGIVTKAPTHTEAGVKTYTCTACGDVITEAIDKLDGHEYVETVKPATCTEDGVKTYTCECGYTKTEVIPATGHTYGDWTADGDNHKKTCTACGDVVTEAHAWDAGEVTVEPGEYEEGEKVYTCTVCGAERTVTIPALGHTHTMTKVDAVEPTCTEAGNVEYYSCDGCGKNYTTEDGSEQILNVVIPALGHSYNEGEVTKAPTHTEEGEKTYTCEVCGDSYTETISKTPDHEYVGAVTKAATHTEEGEMTYTCECGESYAESIAKLPDHVWGEGVVTKEPTTEAEGEMTYTCICGETRTEVIEKLEPTYVPGDVDGNGLIETRDIILVRRYIAGGYGVEINPDAADVDKNGLVETRDIILMRRYIAGGYGVELL